MLKTLNKWIKTSTPWQTLSRFFLVWLLTSTLIISSVTIFGIAPPTPAQTSKACTPNVFYASGFGNNNLYTIDTVTGVSELVNGTSNHLLFPTVAISRDALSGLIFYLEQTPGPIGTIITPRLGYYDPATQARGSIPVTGMPTFTSPAGFLKMAQAADGTIYAADSSNNIYRLGVTRTGTFPVGASFTNLGLTGIPVGSGDIAFDPTNPSILYLTQQAGTDLFLWRISISGSGSVLGRVQISPPAILPGNASLAFGADGNLYFESFNGPTTIYGILASSLAGAAFSNPPTPVSTIPTSISFILSGDAAASGIGDFGTLPTQTPVVNLSVEKTTISAAALPGSPITYLIRMTNLGDCDIQGIRVTDTSVPTLLNTTWSSVVTLATDETVGGIGSMTPSSGVNTNITNARVNLSVGSRLVITYTGTVNPASVGPFNQLNTITATPPPGINFQGALPGQPVTSTATTPVLGPTALPDLDILKTGSSTYTAGSTIAYNLRVRNIGNAPANTRVRINDPAPPGASFVSLSGATCTRVNPALAFPCDLAVPFAVGEVRNLAVTFAIATGTSGPLSNTAEVDSPDEINLVTDPQGLLRRNNRSTFVANPVPVPIVIPPVIPPVVDVAIEIVAPPAVPPGANFTVTLTARNVGTVTADNVLVSYDVPPGVTVVSIPDGCVFNPTASTIICAAIPTFGRGANTSYSFVFTAPNTPTVLTGIARVSTTSPEPNTGNNTAAATTTVALGAPNPNLPPGVVIPPIVIPPGTTPPPATPVPVVIGSALQAAPPVNNRDGTETVSLTVTINNTGTVPLSNLQAVIDLIKTFAGVQDFVVVSINSSTFVVNPNFNGRDIQNLLAAGNVIPPSGSGTVTFSVRVTPGFNLGPFFASVTVQGTDPNGVVVTDISTLGTVPDANGNGTSSDDITPTPIQFTGLPNLRIVKRMTTALRNGAPIPTNLNFNTFLDDPNDGNDNAPGWSALSPAGLARITEANLLQSGDDLEYTVYFLSDGTGVATNAQFCDPVPAGSTFLADTYGAGSGTLLRLEGNERPQTNATDADPGRFIPALTPSPSPCPGSNNPNGAVFVQIPTLSNRSPNNVGFFRFRVRID